FCEGRLKGRERDSNPRWLSPCRFSRPDNPSPKNKVYQEIRDEQGGEVPVGVPSPPSAAIAQEFPPDLLRVIAAWDRLPEPIKAGVLALVQAAGGPNA